MSRLKRGEIKLLTIQYKGQEKSVMKDIGNDKYETE